MAGKISIKQKVETKMNDSIWNVFEKNFQDVKTASEATETLLKVTGGICTTPQTIIKTIERGIKSKEIKSDVFYMKWCEKTNKEGYRKGRKSTREIIEEETGKTFWEVLEAIKNPTSMKDIINQFVEITKIHMGEVTLIKNIEKGIRFKEIEPDSVYANWIVKFNKKGRRGLKPVDQKINEFFNETFIEVANRLFKDIDKIKDAPEQIMKASKGKLKVSVGGIKAAIERLIKKEEIKEDSHLYEIIQKKKTKQKNRENEKWGGEAIPSSEKCQNCGWESGHLIPMRLHKNGNPYPIIGAQRCPNCKRWGSKTSTFNFHGKKLVYKAEEWIVSTNKERYPDGGYYQNFEYFEKGVIIKRKDIEQMNKIK